MSAPRCIDWVAVRRIGRYLSGRPRAVHCGRRDRHPASIAAAACTLGFLASCTYEAFPRAMAMGISAAAEVCVGGVAEITDDRFGA